MLFSLENRAKGNKTHCGVLEFIAEEGMIYMPYWVWPRKSARQAPLCLHARLPLRGRGIQGLSWSDSGTHLSSMHAQAPRAWPGMHDQA